MKVILLKDVEKIGKRDEVIDVKSGFARNFLFPKKLAEQATSEKLKQLKKQKKEKKRKEERELKKNQKLASSLDGLEVIISVRTGDEGQLYESVNKAKIRSKLKQMGFKIEKKQISLKEPIKETGEFPIQVKLGHNLEAEILLIVEEEK